MKPGETSFHRLLQIGACLFLFVTTSFAQSSYYIEYTNQSRNIYKDIIDLKLDSAKIKLQAFEKEHPQNLSRLHLENYLDFFELFINEDEARFKLLEKNKDKRIALIEKQINDDNPYKRFLIAEIKLLQ